MAFMLHGKCPKCDNDVKYVERPPLCNRCQLIDNYKQESCTPAKKETYFNKQIIGTTPRCSSAIEFITTKKRDKEVKELIKKLKILE
jgi:endogenous inhibitor of DNA gyrase (YacG/DUF329 family)